MVAVESQNVSVQYYYDPFGRRLSKTVNGVTTYFYYADEGLVAEIDSTGNVVKTYGYKPDSTWTTDPVYVKFEDEFYFYQNDHLGTPQQLISLGGDIVHEITYESFGKGVIDGTSTVASNLRFAGQYYDAETGLHYNWNRYYDPGTGRYLTTDPIGLDFGVNLYIFANNNTNYYIDPNGEFVICAATATALAAILIEGAIVAGIFYYGAYAAADLGKRLGQAIFNKEADKKDESDAPPNKTKLKKKDRRKIEQKKAKEQKHVDEDWEEPASEDYAKWKAKELEKRRGKDARQKAHDKPHLRDRSKSDLDRDYE